MSEHETGGPPGSRGNVCDMIRGLPEVAEKACGGGGKCPAVLQIGARPEK